METQQLGPAVRELDSLIPLAPFARAMGFHAALYTSQSDWEAVVRHGPYDLCAKLANVVDNALATQRAECARIFFTYRQEGKKVRLKVELFQTSAGEPWVMLTTAVQSRNGRSHD